MMRGSTDSDGHDGRGQVVEPPGEALKEAALDLQMSRAVEDARREGAAHADVSEEASGPASEGKGRTIYVICDLAPQIVFVSFLSLQTYLKSRPMAAPLGQVRTVSSGHCPPPLRCKAQSTETSTTRCSTPGASQIVSPGL